MYRGVDVVVELARFVINRLVYKVFVSFAMAACDSALTHADGYRLCNGLDARGVVCPAAAAMRDVSRSAASFAGACPPADSASMPVVGSVSAIAKKIRCGLCLDRCAATLKQFFMRERAGELAKSLYRLKSIRGLAAIKNNFTDFALIAL